MNDMIARTEQAIADYDSALLDNLDLDDAVKMIIGRLTKEKQRAEAAEARAAQLEAERDEARKQLEQAQEDYERMKEERDNLRMSIVNNVSA